MDQTSFWTQHLKPGERIVWQADASPRLRRAAVSRRRWIAIVVMLLAAVLALAFAYKLYESLLPGAQTGLGLAIAAPLYVALALTFAVVAFAQLGRLNPKLSPAVRFAATPARLIAADAGGALLDELNAQDISGLILGGRSKAPDLYVLRRQDDLNVRAFSIEHIDRPLEAKIFLEEQFLEPADEQAD